MNPRIRGIARREAGLYVRSLGLWVGLAVILFAVFGFNSVGLSGPIELFLRNGDALAVLMTAFVVTLVMGAGLAREATGSFEDVWNSLPTRNTEQFAGKLLGGITVVAVLGAGVLLVIPAGWLMVGTVWTPAATSAVAAFVAQTVAVLLLSVGIATLLRSLVSNVRVRYAIGLGVVVGLSIAQALGIDNSALWAVLLSPYTFGGIPYSHSALFGMFPWVHTVTLHVLFQVLAAVALLVLAALLYQRRRDPAQRRVWLGVLLGLLVVGCGVTGVQYQRYWNDVEAAFQTHLALDTQPTTPWVQLDDGQWERQPIVIPYDITAYDLTVTWAPGPTMHVEAAINLTGRSNDARWPLTLHHQWQISEVVGLGISGWIHEGNTVWLDLEAGASPTQVTISYSGQPLLWDWQIGVVNPSHFISDAGGYLSPLMAWYPLPGQRKLVDMYAGGRPWSSPTEQPLLSQPVPIRLSWQGPADLMITTNLAASQAETHDEVRRFEGRSDGVSVLIGSTTAMHNGTLTLVGAPSVVHGAEPLSHACDALLTFYDALLGREVTREPVVVVPGWLNRFYVTYQMMAINAAGKNFTGTALPLMGSNPAVTEASVGSAIKAATRWLASGDPQALIQATEAVHYGVLQSVWGRPHAHIAFLRDPVARGLAEYSLHRWTRHVVGVLPSSAPFTFQRRSDQDIVDEVLNSLLELEQSAEPAAVTALLGAIYDHLETARLDLDGFRDLLQRTKAGGQP